MNRFKRVATKCVAVSLLLTSGLAFSPSAEAWNPRGGDFSWDGKLKNVPAPRWPAPQQQSRSSSKTTLYAKNQCHVDIEVAVVYQPIEICDYDSDEDLGGCEWERNPESDGWVREGFFRLRPGQEVRVGRTDASSAYFTAQTIDGSGRWGSPNYTIRIYGQAREFEKAYLNGSSNYIYNFRCR